MKVGVIGAGIMGSGVAQSLAQSNHNVVLIDLQEEVLKKSRDGIYNNIRFSGFYNKELEGEDPEVVLERIEFTTQYESLKDADFIVENVPEQWEVKREAYALLEEVCPEHCIYMVNTSCISITKIGALTKRGDKVIGVHFMNPVPLKPVVEAIRGYHTSQETIEATKLLLSSMKKEVILVEDYPGFVSNRISHLFMNEAAYVLQDQVATAEEVDEIFVKCFGHKMGPLRTADLIGLDVVVNSLDILYESYQDPKFRVCPLLRKMVDAGLLGSKSGQGFFEYARF
ncbi:TPA: 3-hydroxyacyl-CoA dehydrogenase family protein [Bacillus pseudomycoides]|nr:3-hydroxyacyl-CoA dehydrogenase family protein [Bacillus pseudomycoides]